MHINEEIFELLAEIQSQSDHDLTALGADELRETVRLLQDYASLVGADERVEIDGVVQRLILLLR